MSEYIEVPIETDPEALALDAFDFVQSSILDWVPNDGNLETIIIEACALITAEAREVASAVPNDIFRYFGKLVDVEPKEASFASSTTAWTMIDNEGYTIPGGTQVGIRIAGDTLVAFGTIVDVVIPNGSTTATDVEIQALEAGDESSGLTGDVELLDTLDFVDTITLLADTSGGADEETDEDYLNRLSTRLQLLTPRPILPKDFAILAQDISGVDRATAIDGYNIDHNLLTAEMSSFEAGIAGWVADVNCAITQETVLAADGTKSLKLTSSASGDMSARTTPNTFHAILPGTTYTATAEFRKATITGKSCRVRLEWLDAAQVFISATDGATITDSNLGWIPAFATGTAPSTAAFVRVHVKVLATAAAAEVHFVDKIALRRGTSTSWTIGGTGEFNQERTVAVAVVDEDGLTVSTPIKQEVDIYLQSLREVNFVVHVIDANYTSIDVLFLASGRPGFDYPTVSGNVVQALVDYLSPDKWGLPERVGVLDTDRAVAYWENNNVVRYLELAQVINEVAGVDYIVTLTFRITGATYGTTNITLGGVAPLPLPGTITGSVSPP